jgi:hypothetical protein
MDGVSKNSGLEHLAPKLSRYRAYYLAVLPDIAWRMVRLKNNCNATTGIHDIGIVEVGLAITVCVTGMMILEQAKPRTAHNYFMQVFLTEKQVSFRS